MKRLKLGMVGGGQGAFIGAVHRIAARIDDQFELVAGALSSDPERAAASAKEIGLERSYGSFQEMAEAEASLDDGIDAVAIVTPNHMHAPISEAFLKAGIHVICDKPLASELADAERLEGVIADSGKLFILTHNYPGTPMVRQAREMVANGDLGQIRMVQVEYVQDWLTEAPDPDQKQAAWRTDPKQAGAGALGDIGTHAYNMAAFVTGMIPEKLCADVTSFVPGRRVDDNAQVLMRYSNGAKGTLWCSQIAVGHENTFTLRVYGDKGGLIWSQEDPNRLWFTPFGEPKRLLTRGGAGTGAAAGSVTRVPAGHPEGYLEAFATIYAEAADAIRAHNAGNNLPAGHGIAGIQAGLEGMRFISACLRSAEENSAWVSL